LTAFYMARLMAMTFFGENRTGAREREHLHEAPWIMTGPLLVLGVLSLAGGVINLPRFAGGHHWLERWLEPVTASGLAVTTTMGGFSTTPPEAQVERLLIGLAIGIAVVGLAAGWRATSQSPIVPARRAPPELGFWKVLYHKYYVDELYDAMIVRPIVWLSRTLLWKTVDQGIVDGAGVNGAANLSRALGWLGSRLQTGQVGVYIVLFVAGALYVLGMVVR